MQRLARRLYNTTATNKPITLFKSGNQFVVQKNQSHEYVDFGISVAVIAKQKDSNAIALLKRDAPLIDEPVMHLPSMQWQGETELQQVVEELLKNDLGVNARTIEPFCEFWMHHELYKHRVLIYMASELYNVREMDFTPNIAYTTHAKVLASLEDGHYRDAITKAALGHYMLLEYARIGESKLQTKKMRLLFLGLFIGANLVFWPLALYSSAKP